MSHLRVFANLPLIFIASTAFCQQASYGNYKGFIGKYPVTMHLHKIDHDFFGYYYYDSCEHPLFFIGDDSTEKGKIKLISFLPDADSTESFIFEIKDGAIANGTFNPGEKNSSDFSAKETSSNFNFIYSRDTIKLKKSIVESPMATFEEASIWPKDNSPHALFLKSAIDNAFEEKNSTEDIGRIFLKQKKKYFADYLTEYKDANDSDLADIASYSMDETARLMIVFQSEKILTLAAYSYSFTGGAHGNYGTEYSSLDLTSHETIKLNDVLNVDGKKQLPRLLAKYFRKAYNLRTTDSLSQGGLFEEKIKPNNDFYVTTKGIGFDYVPYEIGPFAMGEINIFIPFTELSAYLQPAFKKLID
ncbi:MAG TPA: DUF3298 domain-containing protein [Chitinophagaceae bacterium]|jgi:hypothetical protein